MMVHMYYPLRLDHDIHDILHDMLSNLYKLQNPSNHIAFQLGCHLLYILQVLLLKPYQRLYLYI